MLTNDDQQNEIEVLKSIYWDDFTELDPVDNYPQFSIHIKTTTDIPPPQQYHLKDLGVKLTITYNAQYPAQSAPHFIIENILPIETSDKARKEAMQMEIIQLKDKLAEKCKELLGEVVVFAMIQTISTFFDDTTEQNLLVIQNRIVNEQYEQELIKRQTEHKPKLITVGYSVNVVEDLLTEIQKPKLFTIVNNEVVEPIPEKVQHVNSQPSLLNVKRYMTQSEQSTEKVASVQSFLSFNFYKRRPLSYNIQLRRAFSSTYPVPGKNAIYMFGGCCNGEFTNDLFMLKLPTSRNVTKSSNIYETNLEVVRLSHQAPFPALRAFQSMIVSASHIFIIGGMEVSSGHLFNDTWILGIHNESRSWRNVCTLPKGVCGLQTVTDGHSTLWSFGGMLEDGSYNNQMWICKIWEHQLNCVWRIFPQQPFTPSGRIGHSMCLVRSTIYLCGGHNADTIFNDVHCFDIVSQTWTRIITMGPSPSLTFASKLIPASDESLLIYGGFDGKQWSDAIFEYSIRDRSWRFHCSEVDTLPMYTNCDVVGSDLLITGGMRSDPSFSPLQPYFNIILKIMKMGEKLSGHIPRKSDKSDLIGARLMQYQTYNDTVETKSSYTVQSLRAWFRSQRSELSDSQIVFFNDNHETKIIYCNMLVLEQSEVLANCKRKEVNTDKGKIFYIYAHENRPLANVEPRLLYKVIEFLYTNEIVISEDNTDILSEEDVQALYELAVVLKISLLKDILRGEVNFRHLMRYNYSRTLFMAADKLLQAVPYNTSLTTEEENKKWLKSRPVGLVRIVATTSGYYVNTHKGLLIHRSPYFYSMFATKFVESHTNEILIDELSIEAIQAILIYMYTGMIPTITPEICLEIYLSTHQFHLEELQPWLRSIIRENIDTSTVVPILDIAEMIGDTNMKRFCIHYIGKNYKQIATNDNVYYMGLPELLKDEIYLASDHMEK
jgi:hypothetical protein